MSLDLRFRTFGLFEPLTFSLHKVSVVSMRADPTSNFKFYCSPLDVGRGTFIYIVHKLKNFRTLPNVIFTWFYISIFHCHVLLLTVEIKQMETETLEKTIVQRIFGIHA